MKPAQEMAYHIEWLCSQHGVELVYRPGTSRAHAGFQVGRMHFGDLCFEQEPQPAVWVRPVRGIVTYLVALHELGHLLTHCRDDVGEWALDYGRDRLHELEREALAWRWALEQAAWAPGRRGWKAIHSRLATYAHAWGDTEVVRYADFLGLYAQAERSTA